METIEVIEEVVRSSSSFCRGGFRTRTTCLAERQLLSRTCKLECHWPVRREWGWGGGVKKAKYGS